jgi:O-antigen ligase
MKWAVFLIGVMGVLPLIHILRRRPLEQAWVWILLGFFPFLLSAVPNLNLSAISWPIWPGHVKGLQITALDLYAFAIYVALPRRPGKTPFRFAMGFYFFAVVVSIFSAQVPVAAVFYAWQLARMYLVYAVVIKSGADERIIWWIMKGLAAGLLLEACDAMWERFGQGIIQASGSLGHQNLLGLMSHLIVLPFFALLLAGQRSWISTATPIVGAVIWVLTASRATLGLGAIGLVALFLVSAVRKWTSRKARVLIAGLAVLVVFVPLAISSLEARFAANPLDDSGIDERVVLNDAAALMLTDHPFGVGANNFTVVANTDRYYDRVPLSWMSRIAIVHNLYWLTAAEMGYLGIIALLVLLGQLIFVAFRCGWRYRSDQRGDLLLGFGMAIFIVCVHSWYEWIFVTLQVQYLFALVVGLVGGLATQLGYWRQPYRRNVKATDSNLRKAPVGEPVS